MNQPTMIDPDTLRALADEEERVGNAPVARDLRLAAGTIAALRGLLNPKLEAVLSAAERVLVEQCGAALVDRHRVGDIGVVEYVSVDGRTPQARGSAYTGRTFFHPVLVDHHPMTVASSARSLESALLSAVCHLAREPEFARYAALALRFADAA